jgi:hypothetical protein
VTFVVNSPSAILAAALPRWDLHGEMTIFGLVTLEPRSDLPHEMSALVYVAILDLRSADVLECKRSTPSLHHSTP